MTFSRMKLIFILIRKTVARHSCECRTTFIRMSLSFIFSPDSHEVFACFLKTVARPSWDTHTRFIRVSRKFRNFFSPKFRGDRFATLTRILPDHLAKYFGEKICIKFLNMFKTFATSSPLVRDTLKFSQHSCNTRTNVMRNSAKQSREICMPVRY